MASIPWASGPGEILNHALSLLEDDTDVNRRLALICTDNAVELMIKTYLGLPRRVTGINISKTKFREIAESFPRLLDALDDYASDKLEGIDLGEIEWYHRIRNELYHQGNGLTVEREKVDVYSSLAKVLFRNLFGIELSVSGDSSEQMIGSFLNSWIRLERNLAILARLKSPADPPDSYGYSLMYISLREKGVLDEQTIDELDELRKTRNEVVHGARNDLVNTDIIARVRKISKLVEGKIEQKTKVT